MRPTQLWGDYMPLKNRKSMISPSVKAILLCSSLWFLLEVLLLLSVESYPFPWFGLIDSWLYSSLQWNPALIVAQFKDTYYVTRVPAFAPGIPLHKLLDPGEAAILYKLLLSAGMCAGWAVVCYRLAGRTGALLSIAVGVLAPWMVVARSTEYIDNAVLFYASLGLASTTLAFGQKNQLGWAVVGGFCLMSTAMTNVATVAIYGPAFLAYCAIQSARSSSTLLTIGAGICIGAIAACTFFGLLSLYYGGHFFILGQQLLALKSIPLVGNNPYAPQNWLWLYDAGWLVLPLGAAIWGMISLAVAKEKGRPMVGLYAAHVIICFCSVAIEVIGTPVLSMAFYASFLYLTTIPILAVCALSAPKPSKSKTAVYLLVLAIIICMAAFSYALKPTGFAAEYKWIMLVAATLASAQVLVIKGNHRLYGAIQQLILWTMVISSWSLFTAADSRSYGNPAQAHGLQKPNTAKNNYIITHKASSHLLKQFPELDFRVWIDENAKELGNNLASSLFYGYRLLTFVFHPDRDKDAITDKSVILIADQERGEERFSQGVAKDSELILTEPEIIPIRMAGSQGLDLVVFRMTSPERPDESPIIEIPTTAQALLEFELGQKALYDNKLTAHLYGSGSAIKDITSVPISEFPKSDVRDHLASEFVNLVALDNETMVLVVENDKVSSTTCLVQNAEYETLATLRLSKTGELASEVNFPSGSRKVRIVLMSDDEHNFTLPRRLAIYKMSNMSMR